MNKLTRENVRNLIICLLIFLAFVLLVVIGVFKWIALILGSLLVATIAIVLLIETLPSKWLPFLQTKPLQERYPSLSADDFDAILSKIDQFSPQISTACLLIDTRMCSAVNHAGGADSRIGGRPYGINPESSSFYMEGSTFLLQLRIPEWLENSPWRGDLLVIYRVGKYIFEVVRHTAEDIERTSQPLGEPSELSERPLRLMRLPRVPFGKNDRYRNLFDPKLMIDSVKGLKELLTPHSDDPQHLLADVLCPSASLVEYFQRIQIGGSPAWVQSPESPRCAHCGKRLKFIAQVGSDASDAFHDHFDDVIYVFGCPKHLHYVICMHQVS